MADELVEFGDGVLLRRATPADFEELDARMRAEDREEVRVGGEDGEPFSLWREPLAVFIKGDLAAIIGNIPFAGRGELARERLLLMLTTDTVDRHPVAFIRQSAKVARHYLNAHVPQWVDTVYTITTADYGKSIGWISRVLSFEPCGTGRINGIDHVVMCRRKGAA